MMKIIRVIGGGLVSLTLLLLLIGYFLPNEYDFSRVHSIASTCDAAFDYVNDLENLSEFSPWMQRDPTIRFDYTSPSTGEGARVRWTSQESANGAFTITESEAPKRIIGELDFFELGKSEGYLLLDEDGPGCQLRLGFRGSFEAPRPIARWFSTLLPFFVGHELERALEELESILAERE